MGDQPGFFLEAQAGFQVYVVTVSALKGDRIHRSADSDDRATILTQLGVGRRPTPTGPDELSGWAAGA